jgi:hypothetical protein
VERIYFQPTNLGVYTYARPRFWRRQFDDATTRAQFRWEYNREKDPARKSHLAKSYAELTGRDIVARYERLSD